MQIGFEAGMPLGNLELAWQSEWILTDRLSSSSVSPGTSEEHALQIKLPTGKNSKIILTGSTFYNPSQISWLGNPLPSTTNTAITLSFVMDLPEATDPL